MKRLMNVALSLLVALNLLVWGAHAMVWFHVPVPYAELLCLVVGEEGFCPHE